jgi:hypothetical protein
MNFLKRGRSNIDWFAIEPRYEELCLFGSYLAVMENFLAEEAQKERAKLNEFIEKTKKGEPGYDDDSAYQIEQYLKGNVETVDSFANMLRKSFFASLYSFCVSWLEEECRERKGNDIEQELSRMPGRDELERLKAYMVIVLQVKFPSTSLEWQAIQPSHRILRNCIVHKEGRLDRLSKDNAEKLGEFIADTQTLSLSGEEVVLSKDFCEEALETIEQFFRLLYPKT